MGTSITVAYLAAATSIIVAIISLTGSLKLSRKNLRNSIQLEEAKAKIELNKKFQEEKILHIQKLLTLVHALRTEVSTLNLHAFAENDFKNIFLQKDSFDTYYNSTVAETNLLPPGIRTYYHDTHNLVGTLRTYVKDLYEGSESEQKIAVDEIRNACLRLSDLSRRYEDTLREIAKNEIHLLSL